MDTLTHNLLFQEILFFIKGMVVGLTVSIPLGPASIMCLRRTLHRGFFMGFLSGLGVALADTLYGALAGIGITSIAENLVNWIEKTRLLAGCLLIVLGFILWRKKVKPSSPQEGRTGYIRAVLTTFGMTLANPLIFILFTAVFAIVGISPSQETSHLLFCLILGIFVGSMLWWLILSGSMTLLHRKIQFSSLAWTNKLAGLVIIAFGLGALLAR